MESEFIESTLCFLLVRLAKVCLYQHLDSLGLNSSRLGALVVGCHVDYLFHPLLQI